MNTSVLCQERRPAAGLPCPPVDSLTLAERLVNIAGLCAGDRVLFLGDTGAAVKAAVSDAGARILSAVDTFNGRTWKEFRIRQHFRVDAVMCAAELYRQALPAEWLSTIRRHLRPGGRLVMWVKPGRCHYPLGVLERIEDAPRLAVGHLHRKDENRFPIHSPSQPQATGKASAIAAQRQIRGAGFTSIISGSMAADSGEVVVITGVFNYLGIGRDGRQTLSTEAHP